MHIQRVGVSSLLILPLLLLAICNGQEMERRKLTDDRMLQDEEAGARRVGLKQPEKITAGTTVPQWGRVVRSPVAIDQLDVGSHSTNLFYELPLTGPRGKETPNVPKSGRYCENGFERAGFPNAVGRFAKATTDGDHQVGYVGGGTWFGGSCRRTDEGTFGMDYIGRWFSRSTWMRWSHGARHQGGSGRYETEGPRVCPE